ncbi:MAG: class I SAM-dependent DNA methyltransferase [Gloeotrichia echinulata GP01]
MATIRDLLNQVWSEFRKVGISYDLAIIEHIAAFLLEISQLEISDEQLQPQKLIESNLNNEEVKKRIIDAANLAGGTEKLLDRHIIFYLSNMLAGGAYPTPRHIVKTMIYLTEIEPNHSLADFTCGSGGLLVNHPHKRQAFTLGTDISLEWAKISYANIKLHKLTATILHQNAFLNDEEIDKICFDRILMNPPFGGKIDVKLAETTLKQKEKVGSRSETALLALAMKKLSINGRAGVLVPSGLLFSNSKAERNIKNQLVNENFLEAVISFPKDAFQPYSPLQTHLLLFSKVETSEQDLTWFFQVEQDGYPAGKGRDLTQDELPNPSDIPFIEAVWTKRNSDFDYFLPHETNQQIGIKKIISSDNRQGIICQGIENKLESIKYLAPDPDPKKNRKYPRLVMELSADNLQQRLTIEIPLEIEQHSSETTDFNLLSHSVQAVSLAFPIANQLTGINKTRLLGVAVPKASIYEEMYDLRPETYIKSQIEASSIDSPTTLLVDIYERQKQLAQRIDSLFGHLESPPIAKQKLPSPLKEEIQPFGNLNQEQIKIWETVRARVELTNNEIDNYETAGLFTIEELFTDNTDELKEVTRSTIHLLESMGVIVPVTITDPKTDKPLLFYRRVTQRDIWQESNPLNSGEESK